MEGRRGRKGKAGKPYLSFLGEVVLSELKKVAEALQKHRKAAAIAVGIATGAMLVGAPGVLKFSLQHLGPFGTVALVIFGVFYTTAPALFAAPRKTPQRLSSAETFPSFLFLSFLCTLTQVHLLRKRKKKRSGDPP